MSSSRRPCSPSPSSSSPTTSRSTAAPTWTSRATWRRASPSSDRGAPGRSPGRRGRPPLVARRHRHQGDRRAAPQDRRLPLRDRRRRPLPLLPAEARRPRAGLLRGERVLRRVLDDLRGRDQVDDGGQRGLPTVQRRRVGLPARAARGGRAPAVARRARDRGRARRHGALLRRPARGAHARGRRGGGRLGRLLRRARAAAPPRARGERGGGGHLGQRAGGRGAGAARAPRPGGRRTLGRDPRPARHDPDRGGAGALPARAASRERDAGGAGHHARAGSEPAVGAPRPGRGAAGLCPARRCDRARRDRVADARRARGGGHRPPGLTLCCRAGLCCQGLASPRHRVYHPKRRADVPPPPEPVRGRYRGGPRRDPRRLHDHPHGRRGPRERGRPLRRGRAPHGRARQLHGDPRARARLPLAHGEPLRPARPADDGEREQGAARDCVHRLDRRASRHRAGHLGGRPRRHHPHRHPARRHARRHREPGARLPASRPARRRAGARRADRGRRRPGAPRRLRPGGRHLRDPARRRHHGAAPRPGGVRGPPRLEYRNHRRPDRVPEPPRLARAPYGRGAHHDASRRRLPRPRLHHRRGRGRAPRAGQGRHPRRRADARAHAPRVPAGRRLRLPRARHAEPPPEGDGADRRRGQGGDPLPPPRRPRPRPLLRSACRQRARAEHRARRLVARELPRVRHRGADPAGRGRGEDPLADEPSLAPGQPARLRARDHRVRAAHARRAGPQLRDAAQPEAVQGPLRSGAMRRVGVTAVLVGLAALVSAAPLPEDVVRAKLTAGGGQAVVEATIAPGWHVNAHEPRDQFLIPTTVTLTPPAGVRAGAVEYPRPVERRLKFSGETTLLLYDGTVRFTATLEGAPAVGSGPLKAALRFQACDDSRCLPPRTLELVAALDAPAPLGAAEPPAGGQDQVAGWIARWGYPLTFLWVALVGVALNLTPCVYPLISVTVAFFGRRTGAEGAHILRRALLYVLGICVTFSTLGVTAALTGSLFGSALQRPAVLAAIALVLVGLAGSNFGFYQLRLPSPIMQRLGRVGEGDVGAFFMGLTMGVVAAPCIGPAVLALLLFVGAQQLVALGFALFFVLGLGLGAPYLALAALAGRLRVLPRAGAWLEWVERVFGFLLLGLALYFVSPLLPDPWVRVPTGLPLVAAGRRPIS